MKRIFPNCKEVLLLNSRYQRLFFLPENLYADNSPIIISAGALTKDTKTDEVFIQLKIKNICDKRIKAATVYITPMDTIGIVNGSDIEYKYLDLDCARDQEFGQKTPIYLEDKAVRSFSLSNITIYFSDNSTWESQEVVLEGLPQQKKIYEVIRRPEQVEAYKRTFGKNAEFCITPFMDLWLCTCGRANKKSENKCHYCGIAREDIENIDLVTLTISAAEKSYKQTDFPKAIELFSMAIDLLEENSTTVGKSDFDQINNCRQRISEIKREAEAVEQEKEKNQKRLLIEEKRKKRKKGVLTGSVFVTVTLLIIVFTVIIPAQKYRRAISLKQKSDYYHAAVTFYSISKYKDSKSQCWDCWTKIINNNTIAAGDFCSLGLKTNGTVVATKNTGWGDFGDENVTGWTNIVSIVSNGGVSLGLTNDGLVKETTYLGGRYPEKKVNADDWKDIVAIDLCQGFATSDCLALGLKADGTVVASGNNRFGECNVSSWTDIIAVSAGYLHSLGLKVDGTVVAIGDNKHGECNVSDWTDIVAISASEYFSLGLRSDGTVVSTKPGEMNDHGRSNVSNWTDIIAISTNYYHSLGLKSDGTVISTEGIHNYGQFLVSEWTDIVAISAGEMHSLGLKSDGTVVSTKYIGDSTFDFGQDNVSNLTNIKVP